jgi:surfeit locus 1 family protein
MTALTLSLGQWQLNRAAQKEAIQRALEVQGQKTPLDTENIVSAVDKLVLLQQRAVVQGTWLPVHTVYLDNRQMNSRVGFFVVTPLRLRGTDQVLLVQRGWIPRNFEDRTSLTPVETPEGIQTVEGRISPPPSKLYEPGTPAHSVIRQNLDLQQFKAETALSLLPVMLMQTGQPSQGMTRDWPAVSLGIEKHYGYALQWFALAALVASLYLWFQFIQPYLQRTKDSRTHV